MRKPIPPKIRDKYANDPDFRNCLIFNKDCEGRIQWHHPHEGGKRTEKVVPLCEYHHEHVHLEEVNKAVDEWVEKKY